MENEEEKFVDSEAEKVSDKELGKIDVSIFQSEGLKYYARDLAQYPLLTEEEEKKLFTEYKSHPTEQLRDKLVYSNWRLVAYVAVKYRDSKTSLEDLMQEGNMGLVKAVDKFDPDNGAKFSTYAMFWIKQAIRRFEDSNSSKMKIPTHMSEKIRLVKKLQCEILMDTGRDATVEEIAALSKGQLTVEQAKEAMSVMAMSFLDIDSKCTGCDDDKNMHDIIPDNLALTPEQKLLNQEKNAAIMKAIAALKPKEADIIMRRFGLNGKPAQTLEEIAKDYGCTREWIRQVEAKVIRKLKRNAELKEYAQ